MELQHFDITAAPVTGRQVSRHGRPAESLPHDGMPAYETAHADAAKRLYVMESLICFDGPKAGAGFPLMIPWSYKTVCLRAKSDLAALHDHVDAAWIWRPKMYDLRLETVQGFGSQQELEWRIALHEAALALSEYEELLNGIAVKHARRARAEGISPADSYPGYAAEADAAAEAFRPRWHLPWMEAKVRARETLLAWLTPQQRLEYLATDKFFVRGTINTLYQVDSNNGLQVVDPETARPLLYICLHTDEWIPGDDNALAAKLLIDSGPDGEEQLLAGGNCRLSGEHLKPEWWERELWSMHRELIPEPLQ